MKPFQLRQSKINILLLFPSPNYAKIWCIFPQFSWLRSKKNVFKLLRACLTLQTPSVYQQLLNSAWLAGSRRLAGTFFWKKQSIRKVNSWLSEICLWSLDLIIYLKKKITTKMTHFKRQFLRSLELGQVHFFDFELAPLQVACYPPKSPIWQLLFFLNRQRLQNEWLCQKKLKNFRELKFKNWFEIWFWNFEKFLKIQIFDKILYKTKM